MTDRYDDAAADDATFVGTLSHTITPSSAAREVEVASHHGLLILEKGESWMAQLPPQGEVVIGRSQAAGIRLRDQAVSRRHAVIQIDATGATITDAGSYNGTEVNGARLAAAHALRQGDTLKICSATLMFFTSAAPTVPRATGAVVAEATWSERLGEEVERALRSQRPFAVFCVALPADVPASHGDAAIEAGLRRFDVAAWTSRREYLVLAPEVPGDAAGRMAQRLREVAARLDADARVGYAMVPDDGWDPVGLVAAARAAAQAAQACGVAAAATSFGTLTIGDNPVVLADAAMSRLYAVLERVAASDLSVLIVGETGTGKELAATALHERSRRRAGPLVALNCAAMTESLAESELFGHERGAFSGAVATKRGLLEAASGGTLFLDEIGELSLAIQAKLLRVLESRRFLRVGDVRERDVDIRLVAATHRDLEQEVVAGRFRQDLFYRLNAAVLRVPPLRERKRELPLLADLFLARACEAAQRRPMQIDAQAMAALAAHEWPGNVRELKNVMDYMAAAQPEPVLRREHVVHHLGERRTETDVPRPLDPAPMPPAGPRSFRHLADEVRELEIARITEALDAAGGNHRRAAELIGMPLRTFFGKVKQYGLRR